MKDKGGKLAKVHLLHFKLIKESYQPNMEVSVDERTVCSKSMIFVINPQSGVPSFGAL